MLGRLPFRYRLAIWFAGLVTFALVGVWFGIMVQDTPTWSWNAALGALLGAAVVAAFLHVMERQRS